MRRRLLLRCFNDEQCLLAAAKLRGLEVGLRQRRAWRNRQGPTWEGWQALTRDQKISALNAARQRPHPSPELAQEAMMAGAGLLWRGEKSTEAAAP